MPYSSGLQESNACRFPFGICRLPEHRCLDLRFQLCGLFQPHQQYCCKNLCAGRMRHCLWDETIRTRFRRHTSCKNGFSQRMGICFSRPLFFCDITLELVFIGNICGFSSKFFCRQGKNLQAYFRMARIFNAVCNKICRKDVDGRL